MPQRNLHDEVLRAYILHLTLQDTLMPPHELAIDELLLILQADMEMYRSIRNTRYLNAHTSIPSLEASILHGSMQEILNTMIYSFKCSIFLLMHLMFYMSLSRHIQFFRTTPQMFHRLQLITNWLFVFIEWVTLAMQHHWWTLVELQVVLKDLWSIQVGLIIASLQLNLCMTYLSGQSLLRRRR